MLKQTSLGRFKSEKKNQLQQQKKKVNPQCRRDENSHRTDSFVRFRVIVESRRFYNFLSYSKNYWRIGRSKGQRIRYHRGLKKKKYIKKIINQIS